MPTVDVLDLSRQKVRTLDLKEQVFGVRPNEPLVHEAVVMQQACERQGTASTLRRGEVSGSGKKPFRQKHTGRARVGSVRSPVWRHGGTVFGPKPRQYRFSMPKKKYRAALRTALSSKLSEGGILVVADLALEHPKTRVLAKMLAQLGVTKTGLIVTDEHWDDLERAVRNLRHVKLIKPHELNVYDILRYDALVIPERVMARVQEVWL